MSKFRQTNDILKAMNKKENIRNVGVVAHIDHGKTTLTDSLLAKAGLIPSQIAGTARVLDYLVEEQKRGITIKTASISLLHQTRTNSYVINLMDTPGHVDFNDKVARALRTIDGVIVVVDAVEEIMAQTQIVMRQALGARVKPILFINKIDRLIKEMKLPEKEIQKRLIRIINDFNNIIGIYCEEEFKDEWKVNPAKGSVIFGSALDKWGFILGKREGKEVKFDEITEAYRKHQSRGLEKILPLHEAVLDAIVKELPNPLAAQKYRVPRIWKGNIASEIGKGMLNCEEEAPTMICVTNVQMESDTEPIITGRIFSGSAAPGDVVYLVNAREEFKIKQVFLHMGAFRESVDRVIAGNVAALTGSNRCKMGETITDQKCKSTIVPFEQIEGISERVITVAIEPKDPNDLQVMIRTMENLALTDPGIVPSVDQETGEYLISGIGELHLEIALKSLRENSGIIQLIASDPTVNHRESIGKKGKEAIATSPHQRLFLTAVAEPTNKGEIDDEKEELWVKDDQNNMLSAKAPVTKNQKEYKNSIITSFRSICRTGPICAEPLRNVRISLLETKLTGQSENSEAANLLKKVTYEAMLRAGPILLEPIYRSEIVTPTELLGKCTRIMAKRRGKISQTQQKGAITIISGYVPVTETFNLSTELRSSTSGQAFWQCTFDGWQETPENITQKLIREIRKRKGLPSETPKPQTFTSTC